MTILGLEKDQKMSLSLDAIRALNSQGVLRDNVTFTILQELRDGPKTYQELITTLRGKTSPNRLLNRLNDLITLQLVKEKSGERKIVKRRYALLEHVTPDFLDHLKSTRYQWPDPWQHAILQSLWDNKVKKQLDTTSAFLQCPFLSKNQVRNVLEGFVKRSWSLKHVTRVGRRPRVVHELNYKWFQQYHQDLKERIEFLSAFWNGKTLPVMAVPLHDVPTFFLNKHRFLHLYSLFWLHHVKDRAPYVVDLQRALFMKKDNTNSILKELANLKMLEVYKTEQSGARRIIPNKKRMKAFLDCLSW